MARPVTTIRNLGPAMATAFAKAGIEDADTLRAMGADAAYARLIEAGQKPHFMAYAALALGLQGRPWTEFQGAEKTALRARFDALKAAHAAAPRSALEAALDEIGVVPRR